MAKTDDLDLFIDGWDDNELELATLEDLDDYAEFLESDSESLGAFIDDAIPVIRSGGRPTIADTQATIALHIWSSLTNEEKNSQISTALQRDQQQITFHRLPSALYLTA